MREATRALAELRAEAASESESRARELERARTRESKALQAAEEARQREAEGKDEGREQVKYEPSSELLHNSVKLLFLNRGLQGG